MMYMFSVSILFTIFLKMLTLILSLHLTPHKDTSNPFECGFDPMNKSRVPFSMQFFLLAILFLVFDIEIALIIIIPLLMTTKIFNLFSMSFILFLTFLTLGLTHEWNEGSMLWKPYKT